MYTQNTISEKNVQVERSNYRPKEYDFIKARQEGKHYITVKGQLKRTKTHIKKISDTQYEVLKTGEIKEFAPLTRQQRKIIRKQSLRRTFEELKALIRANFVNEGERGCKQQLFVTLTYEENMTDSKRLYTDFDKWYKRLKYHYPDHEFEYIAVAEPQERGAWHFHVMLKVLNKDVLFIPYARMAKLWPHGFSETVRLKSDDIGNYYVAYFTDILGSNDKQHKKGSRLDYYPANFKFYRCSRGIVRPQYEEMLFASITQDMPAFSEVYKQSYNISKAHENSKEILNQIYKGTYKRKH